MGTIDRTDYKLSCPKCNITESATVLDHGSNWNGSWWQSEARFSNFETQWIGGGSKEPELISAKCKHCGAVSIVNGP